MLDDALRGARILREALGLARQPGLRLWIAGPLAANIVLFSLLYGWAASGASDWLAGMAAGELFDGFWAFLNTPARWLLEGLRYLVWVVLLLLFAAIFPAAVNLLAAPLNGLLAEQVAVQICKASPTDESLGHMLRRTLAREWTKLAYWLKRALGVAIIALPLSFIPGINLLVPVIWGLFGAWILAFQYIDYGADLQHVPVAELLARMRTARWTVLGFGGASLVITAIPLANLIIVPVSVIGGTVLWHRLRATEESIPPRIADHDQPWR